MKVITHGNETRDALARGITKLVDTVRHTLGPQGGHTLLGGEFSAPRVLDDGAIIAREFELGDPTENAGAQLALMVAERTNKNAGDGTTTSLVLAEAFVNAMLEEDKGFGDRKETLARASLTVSAIESNLKKMASPIGTKDVFNVAYISSGDKRVANLISEAYEKLGLDATIVVKDSRKTGFSVDVRSGMKLEGTAALFLRGTRTTVPDCPVLVIDGPLNDKSILTPFVKDSVERKALLVVADSFSESVLDAMTLLSMRDFTILPVKAPHYAEKRADFLKDLALFTGGELNSKLGWAESVDVTMFETIVTGGKGNTTDRVNELKALADNATSDYDRKQVEERITSLTSGVAIVLVGMDSEAEQRSVVAKIEDAINAVKAAIDGGIVPGGGVSLVEASNRLYTVSADQNDISTHSDLERRSNVNFEPLAGIVYACSAPFRTICTNMGTKSDDVSRYGPDVVDPLKVELNALRNAWSVARMVYLCECGIVWAKDPVAAVSSD